jgi:acyl-CoA synthetase (AMP-forming)/AMP-acid ligase II
LLECILLIVLFPTGYGMTEISSVSHIVPPEVKNSRAGSSGVVIPGTSTKIVVLDSGNIAKPMEAGEICVRGPQVPLF